MHCDFPRTTGGGRSPDFKTMRACVLHDVRALAVRDVPTPQLGPRDVLLRVAAVGLCGTDLNSFRGRNPLVTFPRVIGHEIAATVAEGSENVHAGTRVTVSPYTSCGVCASCLSGRFNACKDNQTFGVKHYAGGREWFIGCR